MSKSIFQLEADDCRFILPNNRYCSEPRANAATSYCAEHHTRCYMRGTAKYNRHPVFLPVDKIEPPQPAPEHKIPDVIEAWK